MAQPGGFVVWQHLPRRYARQTRERIQRFIDTLRCAG
jgi:hypothetical protein